MSSNKNNQQLLNKVKEYHFDPRLTSEEQVCAFLMEKSIGAAHPFNGNLLYRATNGGVETISLDGVNPQIFLDAGNRQGVEGQITTALQKFGQLSGMRDYTVEFLTTGSAVSIKVIPGKILTFVASKRTDNHYFDFTAYTARQTTNYNGRNGITGLTHSGDIGSLLHTITPNRSLSAGQTILFGAVGYRKRSLRYFVNQVPVFALADHENKVIYLVPLPLDQATLGNATFAGLVVGKYDNRSGYMDFRVLSSPAKLGNIDTCFFGAPVKRAVESAFVDAAHMQIEQDTEEAIVAEEAAVTAPEPSTSASTCPTRQLQPILQFVQAGLDEIIPVSNSDVVSFGRGLNSSTMPPMEKSIVNLPVVFGPAGGVAALALGQQPVGDCIPSQEQMQGKLVVVHVGEDWLDSMTPACQWSGNAIFIIHPKQQTQQSLTQAIVSWVGGTVSDAVNVVVGGAVDDNGGNGDGSAGAREALEDSLNKLNTNALCMAGPTSIVLVQHDLKLYFYRGVRWAGLLDQIPPFGEEVTELFTDEALQRYITSGAGATGNGNICCLPIGSAGSGTQRVYFRGEWRSLDGVLEQMSTMSMEELSGNKELQSDVVDVLTQLSTMMKPSELEQAVGKMSKHLDTMVDEHVRPIMQGAMDYKTESIEAGSFDPKKFAHMMGQFKGERKKARRSIGPIALALENCISVKGSSSRKANLERLNRKTQIAANVQKAQKMTLDEKLDFLDEYCTEVGLILGAVDGAEFTRSIQAVSNGNFGDYLQQVPPPPPLASTDERIGLALDSTTIGSLIELGRGGSGHPLFGQKSLAFPHHVDSRTSMVPIVARDENVNLKNPAEFHWPDHAQEEQSSIWRILMRETLASANSTRDYHISPKSNDLGFFIGHLLLCVMERISGSMSTPPTSDNREAHWDDTTCQVLRGLFGELLCLFGSGSQKPMSMLWQWVKPNSNLSTLTVVEQDLLARMARIMPYTAWPIQNFRRNCQKYITRLVRREVTDPVTEPLRKAAAEIDAQQTQNQIEDRNRELAWLRLAVELIIEVRNQKLTKENAQRLLELLPETAGANGMESIVKYVKNVRQGVKDPANPDADADIMQIAVNVYIQRSRCFKEAVKVLAQGVKRHKEDISEKANVWFTKQQAEILAKASLPDGTIKMQNAAKRANPPSAHTPGALSGDAEGNEFPWSIGGPADEEQYESDMRYVLTGSRDAGSVSAGSDGVVAKKEVTLSDQLALLPKGEKASKLAVSFPAKSWEVLLRQGRSVNNPNVNLGAVRQLCSMLGIEGDESLNDMLHVMVQIMLENWRDPKESEDLARKAVFQ